MKTKKIISIMLAVLMLTTGMSTFAFAENEPIYTATVSLCVSDGNDSIAKHTLTTSSDIAEKYGYETAEKDHNGEKIESVTFFDVLVSEHEAVYGDSFKNNPEDYLVMNSGYIMKAFGKNASASGFIINNVVPNDGIVNPAYGSCTGYACDTAPVADGDNITYYFYNDLRYYADCYSWFDSDNYTVNAQDLLKVNLKGYSAMYYGCNTWDTILAEYAENLAGVSIYTTIDGEKVLLGTTDKDGNAEFSFSEEGEYLIFAEGETDDKTPIIVCYADVTVSPQQLHKNTFLDWLKDTWNIIKNWFVKVFSFLFGRIK